MFISLYRRQFIVGASATLFAIAAGITLIVLFTNWGMNDMIFIAIMITFVGIIIGQIIFRQGIKGRRLKEERDFRFPNNTLEF